MNAIERIIKRIEEDAQWKIREYEEKAQRDLEEIKKKEEMRWEEERKKLELEGRREAESIRQMHISQAHLEGKKILMSAREKVIDAIIQEMISNARELLSEKYDEYLKRSIMEAKNIFGDELRLVVLEDDVKRVKKIAKDCKVKAEIVPGDVPGGGVIAMSMDSLKMADYSVKSFIGRNIPEIRKKINERLFGEEYA